MIVFAGDIQSVFWIAVIPAALCMITLVFFVKEPTENLLLKRGDFRLADALRLNRSVWGAIGLASIIMLARFSEAFVLLKALEAGFAPSWVPLSLVILHPA